MSAFDFIDNERLKKQILFLVEIDRMKEVFRRTININSHRRENDAEHSWSFALYGMLLNEYAGEKIDVDRVMRIGLVHDLVEIYAGDTFAYDSVGALDKRQRELAGADRLFGMLDADQRDEIRGLWDEFEAKETPEAKFANCCDRLQPLIHNYLTQGHTWKEGNVKSSQVLERMSVMKDIAPELWNVAHGIIKESLANGWLRE